MELIQCINYFLNTASFDDVIVSSTYLAQVVMYSLSLDMRSISNSTMKISTTRGPSGDLMTTLSFC